MLRQRSFWMALAAVLYVGAAGLVGASHASLPWVGMVAGPLLLIVGFQLLAPPTGQVDRIAPQARSAAYASLTGVVMLLQTRLAAPTAGMQLGAVFAVALASVPAAVALSRVRSLGGIAELPALRALDVVGFTSLLWMMAGGLALMAVAEPERGDALGPDALPYAVVAASLATAGMTIVAAMRVFRRHRFELGVAERVAAALWLEVLCLSLGVLAALTAVAPAELVVPASVACGGLAVCWASVSSRPARVSRGMRTAVSLMLLAAPVVSIGVVLAYKLPLYSGVVIFWVAMGCSLLGLIAPRLAKRLAPERGQWLDVLQRAVVAAKQPDPRHAVTAALRCVADGFGYDAGSAAVVRLASEDRLRVDRAGYLHAEPDELPLALLAVARNEPEQVVSTETLRHVQVRRPDVRPLVAWLDARDAGAAALVIDEEVEVGVLLWPAVGRVSPLSFEEAGELRRLALHLGAAAGADAQLARSRARELEAQHATVQAHEQVQVLEQHNARRATQARGTYERMAASARKAAYSPAAQQALADLERAARRGPHCLLRAPGGVDVQAWVATFHLASKRAEGPLIWVWGGDEGEAALERWRDPQSPLRLAAGGTLALIDAHALDPAAQRYVASAAQDVTVVAVVNADQTPLDELLDGHLAALVGPHQVVLPGLIDRAEDLRALALLLLSRIGVRLRGEPLGLSMGAQQLLNEHHWLGNEMELEAVLWRAALAGGSAVIDAEQLAAALPADAPAQSGPAQSGPAQSGPAQSGPAQSGPAQSGRQPTVVGAR